MKKPIWILCFFLLTIVSQTIQAEPEHRPSLNQIRSPELTQALTSPEAFWIFITAPETAYSNRMAAAAQGVEIFPLKWLPRLLAAQAELAQERGLHNWGMKPNPNNSALVFTLPSLDKFLKTGLPREREILGHRWIVPETGSPYPMSWTEESLAPWPWQVQQALNQFYAALCPSDPYKLSRAPAWLDETMQLPWGTDGEAQTFVRLSNGSAHLKTMAVMARWRKIALDPSKPNAARDVAVNLSSAVRLWDDPASQTVGQVILTDIIRSCPNESAKQEAAWHLGEQRYVGRVHVEGVYEERLPLPVTSLLAVSEAATNSARGEQWTRLCMYVTGACKALDSRELDKDSGLMKGKFVTGIDWNHPPLNPDEIYRMDPQSPKVGEFLKIFEQWFHRNEKKLRKETAKESPEIERVRKELIALEP